jgi:beta-galactosidase
LAGAVRDAETIRLGQAVFDAASGLLLRLGSVAVDGPVLDVWRAPIENDHGQGGVNDVERTWRAVGLDRVIHRTDAVEIDGARLVVTGRTAAAGQAMGLATVFAWELVDDALALTVTIEPHGAWEETTVGNHTVTLPRLGVRIALSGDYGSVEWFGRGPGESYVDSRAAARVGRFRSSIDALQTPYVVPQENGNHVDTRILEVSGAGPAGAALPTLRVIGDPGFAFTARRWRSDDLGAADHPCELRDTGRVWLNLDHAQRGIGSAACGPALPSQYDVPVASATFRLAFAVLAR